MGPTLRTRVKICCIKSVDEATMAIAAGASALGLVSPMPSGPGTITDEEVATIAATIPPAVSTFLLTCRTDPDAIIDQHRRCGTSVIQLCDYLEPAAYPSLRRALPGIKLVQVIHVVSDADVGLAERVSGSVDAILLDSGNPTLKVKELGGTGRVHNWGLSRAIRERVGVPVFLAGGLRPENAAAAIREVSPFGLDICSGVRTGDKLDPVKLRAFFQAVNETVSASAPA